MFRQYSPRTREHRARKFEGIRKRRLGGNCCCHTILLAKARLAGFRPSEGSATGRPLVGKRPRLCHHPCRPLILSRPIAVSQIATRFLGQPLEFRNDLGMPGR